MSALSAVPVLPEALPQFKPRAVVDWIEVVVDLKSSSHGGYLKNAYASYGVSQVLPQDKGPGGAATRFIIRLQNPASSDSIKSFLSDLERAYGLLGEPKLIGLEVSLDLWPVGVELAVLPELTRLLMMGLTPPTITNPRLIGATSSISLPDRHGLDPEMTLYIGNDADDLLWRVYWKRTDETFIGDDGKRVTKPLPPEEQRARAEVRVRGHALAALGLGSPHDLQGFKFERLYSAGYFKFCCAKPDVAVLDGQYVKAAAESLGVDEHSPACVLAKFARLDERKRELKGGRYLMTDERMAEVARGALRGLSKRF